MSSDHGAIKQFVKVAGAIVATAIVGGILGGAIAAAQADVYEADASIIVTVDPAATSTSDDLLNSIDVLDPNVVGTYVQVLSSRTLLDEARDSLRGTYGDDVDDVDIRVRPVENSSVLVVTTHADMASLAADAANAVAEIAAATSAAGELGVAFPLRVLDPAERPNSATYPVASESIVLGAIAGIALAIGLILLRQRLRPDPGDDENTDPT